MGSGASKVQFRDLKIGTLLGQGAFGEVKLGTRKESKELYAVKMTNLGSPEEIQRAGHEHRILQQVNGHENITKYYSFDIENSKACLVMEYCNQGNLNDFCTLMGWPEQEMAIRFCRQMAAGLKHLHHHQIAHSDLKPDNVLIHNGMCKISDMGVAKTFEAILGTDNYAIQVSQNFTFSNGTPVFWAPEIIQRILQSQSVAATGSKCDIFSLGLIALALFTREAVPRTNGKKMVAPLIDSQAYGQCSQDDIDAAVRGSGAPGLVQDSLLSMLRVKVEERATAARACDAFSKPCSIM